jgi:phosphatidate cytidylyltransferase
MRSKQRVISVTLGIIVYSLIIAFSSERYLSVFAGVVAFIAFNEFIALYALNRDVHFYRLSLLSFAILGSFIVFTNPARMDLGFIFSSFVLLTSTLILSKSEEEEEKLFRSISIVTLGGVYICLFLIYMIRIRLLENGKEYITILSIGTWMRDISAYIFGKLTKKGHLIVPSISPRKTYEGAFFGAAITTLAISISSFFLLPTWEIYNSIELGIIFGVFGQVGDFVESWFKRCANAKDSGNILPGEGGLLDAFDSFIFTAPVMYIYLVARLGT